MKTLLFAIVVAVLSIFIYARYFTSKPVVEVKEEPVVEPPVELVAKVEPEAPKVEPEQEVEQEVKEEKQVKEKKPKPSENALSAASNLARYATNGRIWDASRLWKKIPKDKLSDLDKGILYPVADKARDEASHQLKKEIGLFNYKIKQLDDKAEKAISKADKDLLKALERAKKSRKLFTQEKENKIKSEYREKKIKIRSDCEEQKRELITKREEVMNKYSRVVAVLSER